MNDAVYRWNATFDRTAVSVLDYDDLWRLSWLML
jgi:hypothetical protein